LDQPVVVVAEKHFPGETQLAKIGEAGGLLGLDFGLAQNRKEERCQNGNRGNNRQQLKEREPSSPRWPAQVHILQYLQDSADCQAIYDG
jgi:hypothetical protein